MHICRDNCTTIVLSYLEIYFNVDRALACFRSQESAEIHARNHDNQERINESFYPGGPAYCQDTCTKEQHFHCVLVSHNVQLNIMMINTRKFGMTRDDEKYKLRYNIMYRYQLYHPPGMCTLISV